MYDAIVGTVEYHSTHLFAQSLDIDLGKLLAAHEALDPTIDGGDRSWLCLNRGQIGRRSPDILHVGVHGLIFSCTYEGVLVAMLQIRVSSCRF